MSWPWGAYLGDEGLKTGIRAKTSSWQRVGPNVIPHAAKATGVYLNSMLAVVEAQRAGYEEAILLTEDGYVGDGSGENIFVVKPIIRTDLYVADELFMTGTAAEVTPIRSVDDHEIGDPGPITRRIQETY